MKEVSYVKIASIKNRTNLMELYLKQEGKLIEIRVSYFFILKNNTKH